MYRLTDERYSFHTFLLSKSITFEDYRNIKNAIYDIAKSEKFRVFQEKNCTISEQFKRFGVIVRLFDNGLNLPHIELRVNPRITCGEYDYIGIFNCTKENIETVKNQIDAILSNIHSPYLFDDMTLSRIDLCVNLELDEPIISEAYMRCIRKCYVPKPFRRDRFQPDIENSKEKNKHSFRAISNESDFTIYDKIFQAKTERLIVEYQSCPPALIRFEVSLKRPAILKYIKQHFAIAHNTELLWLFGSWSQEIIRKYVLAFFPAGYYLTYKNAKDKILHASIKYKIKKRMLALLENTRYCENLNSAVKELKNNFRLTDYQVSIVMQTFSKLGLNPVTLTNKSIYTGFQGIDKLMKSAFLL